MKTTNSASTDFHSMTRREQVQYILNQHPRLHDGGYGLPRGQSRRPVDRQSLLSVDSVLVIDNIVCWLALNIQPTCAVNRRHTSYGLKHVYERATGEYCSNGQFITACLIREYKADLSRYNPSFAMSERSIKRAIAHAEHLREVMPWRLAA